MFWKLSVDGPEIACTHNVVYIVVTSVQPGLPLSELSSQVIYKVVWLFLSNSGNGGDLDRLVNLRPTITPITMITCWTSILSTVVDSLYSIMFITKTYLIWLGEGIISLSSNCKSIGDRKALQSDKLITTRNYPSSVYVYLYTGIPWAKSVSRYFILWLYRR